MSNPTGNLSDRLASPEESGLTPDVLLPLLRLLGRGRPVDVAELADAAGRTVEAVRRSLAAVPDTEYDPDGRIVGQGLTLRPTPHKFTLAGRRLYTWCALDTLVFPALLDQAAQVESTSPTSGATVRVTVEPGRLAAVEPDTAVVSLVNPDDMTSVRSSFCNQVHYFTSEADARPWHEENPAADIVSVADAHTLGTALTERFLNPHRHPADSTTDQPHGCRCNC